MERPKNCADNAIRYVLNLLEFVVFIGKAFVTVIVIGLVTGINVKKTFCCDKNTNPLIHIAVISGRSRRPSH